MATLESIITRRIAAVQRIERAVGITMPVIASVPMFNAEWREAAGTSVWSAARPTIRRRPVFPIRSRCCTPMPISVE